MIGIVTSILEELPAIQLDILTNARLNTANPTGSRMIKALEKTGYIQTRMNHTQTYSFKKNAKVYERTEKGERALPVLRKASKIISEVTER